MNGPRPHSGSRLRVHVERRVHPGLHLDVALSAGDECLMLLGPSGAGKTSLLRLIAGLDRPDSGEVELDGRVLLDSSRGIRLPLRRRGIGMIFQHHHLFPHLTVAGNLAFGLDGWSRAEARARVEEVADLCGVGQLLGGGTDTLSGGERQRVGLARALAPRPGLLLCDEPFSSLDAPARVALGERLRGLRRAEGIPMLFVTHSPAEAVSLGDRLLVIERGRVAAEGAPLDVLASWHPAGTLAGRTGLDRATLGLRNVFRVEVVGPTPEGQATRARIADGPELILPGPGRAVGAVLLVTIRADDILLAPGPAEALTGGLSARNILSGTIEGLVPHGAEAEVVVRVGGVRWLVSLVAPAVEALALRVGSPVALIIKSRSCHVLDEGGPSEQDGSVEERS